MGDRTIQQVRRDRWMRVLFLTGLFAAMLLFFTYHRPLILDNADDWTYIAFSRDIFPVWKAWNPARVLPEILMPLCGHFSAAFLMPLTGDFISGLALGFALALSGMITLYFYLLIRWLRVKIKVNEPEALMLCALSVVLHFAVFRSPWIGYGHMFYAYDVTCVFFYTIPALLSMQLILYLETSCPINCFLEEGNWISKGFVLMMTYLAIFSNLYTSEILSVYAGVILLTEIYGAVKKKITGAQLLRRGAYAIYVLAAWVISAIYELSGGRQAWSPATEEPIIDRLKQTFWGLMDTIERMEDKAFYLCVAVVTAALVLAIVHAARKDEEGKKSLGILCVYLTCAVLSTLYLMLLSAVVMPGYIGRMDVLLGVSFFVFLAVIAAAAQLIRRWRPLMMAVPVVTCVLAFGMIYLMNGYLETNVRQRPHDEVFATSRVILNQALEADEAGETVATIVVPQWNDSNNWPHASFLGERMLKTLTQYGLTDHLQQIVVETDPEFHERFGMK